MEQYDIPGTIRLFGSPAEEMLASRPYMVRAGLFEGVDAIIDTHWSSRFSTSYGVRGNALFSVLFTFQGKTSHGASPWGGRSALDAVEIMNVSTNFLREHLYYTYRMHYVILEGGEAPNVVPDQASVWYFLRNTDGRIEDMYQRVQKCAEGAALATGTDLKDVRVLTAIHQYHENKALAEIFQANIQYIGMPEWSEQDQAFARALQAELGRDTSGMPAEVSELKPPRDVFVGGASTDVGEVSLIAPTATIRFPGGVPGAIGHHWSNVACTYGPAARKGLIAGAKAMGASGIDLLIRPEKLQAVRDGFEEYRQDHPYHSFLPEGAEPPLGMNLELMDKWRPVMESLYGSADDQP